MKTPETDQEISAWLEALSVLSGSPGWEIFQDFLARQEADFTAQLDRAPDAHTMAKVVGALKAIRLTRGWLDQTTNSCRSALDNKSNI